MSRLDPVFSVKSLVEVSCFSNPAVEDFGTFIGCVDQRNPGYK